MIKEFNISNHLYEIYLKEKSVWRVAKLVGLSGQRVHYWLKKGGHKLNNTNWTTKEDELLIEYYGKQKYQDGDWLNEIANKLNRTRAGIACRANELGLTSHIRPLSIKGKDDLSKKAVIRWQVKPNPSFLKNHIVGRVITQEHRDNISKAGLGRKKSRESIMKMMKTKHERNTLTPIRKKATWKAGKAKDLGNIHFRSKWERNYARFLNYLIKNKHIVKWEYEIDVFWFEKIKRGVVSYKPDFKVHNLDGSIEYHEVKGWMDSRSKTKIKRMAKYHPKVILQVIDTNVYKDIKNKLSRLIENWEY
mgnify:CR=1 FL=1